MKAFLLAAAAIFATPALAQPQPETVTVLGRQANLTGIATSANEGSVSASDMGLRPLLRPGEIVENIPGVSVSQHSGSGKANQYYLRGFNLDHGTDLAITVNGAPVNMVSHGHGQGYADLNFVIPELISRVDYRKGPYYAEVGDFGAAGAFDIRYYDRLPFGLAKIEGGQFGYGRAVIADNLTLGQGNLLYGLSFEHSDGPWDLPDDSRKWSGALRYSEGGFSLTAEAYHNIWNATDQTPQRAVAAGLISRWGNIDPTDGGKSGRYTINAGWDLGDTHFRAYGLYSHLRLHSNFTYFLDDPVNGDQFEQVDVRFVMGGHADRVLEHALGGMESVTTVGADLRHDNINNALYKTMGGTARLGTTTKDHIAETSLSGYLRNETHWLPWLRSIVGVRLDQFWFDVTDKSGAGNSGITDAAAFGPKAGLVFGPWEKTELYLNYGTGFHSNDARGLFAPAGDATPIARATGGEVGIRSGIIPGVTSSVSFWLLNMQSELTWVGDAGTTEPGARTRRYGIEFANFWTPTDWLTIDLDYAWSKARFIDFDPAGQYVPESLVSNFDGGIAIHDLGGWADPFFAGLRMRYFGPRPLVQDNTIRSRATTLLYADLGWNISERFSVQLNVFNLLDARASDIDYVYTSRLPGEPAGGVDDVHTHPSQPREFRLSLTARL
jgi:hypothetical protein